MTTAENDTDREHVGQAEAAACSMWSEFGA